MTTTKADRGATIALGAAVGWALLIGLLFAFVPAESSESVSSSSNGPTIVTTDSSTLVESEGPSVLLVLAVPVALAAVALVRRRRTTTLVIGWLTVVCCLLGAMSVGLFYLPMVPLLFVAAALQSAPRQAPVAASRQ